MSLVFQSVRDTGELSRERVVIASHGPTRIGNYCLFALSNNLAVPGVTAGFHIPIGIWFPNLDLKDKDLVVVYSKVGQYRTKTSDHSKGTTHFFYLDSKDPIWSSEKIMLFGELKTWTHFASYGDESLED